MKLKFFFLLALVAVFTGAAEARNLVGVKIDYAQYGEFLGEKGIGNVLYNYTYDDGVYILKAKKGIQLNPGLNLYGDGSPADIKIATSTRGYSSKYVYVIMRCDSELYYQHGEVTRSSYGCGDEMIRDYEFTEERYNIFKNNLVQRQITVNYQSNVDKIFINGAVWEPPQRGSVQVLTQPDGALISDQSGIIGTSPLTLSGSGSKSITISKIWYVSKERTISFTDGKYGQPGSSEVVTVVLDPVPVPQPEIVQPSIMGFIDGLFDWLKSIGIVIG